MKKKVILITLLFCLLFAAFSIVNHFRNIKKTEQNPMADNSLLDNEVAESFADNSGPVSLGAFSFGIISSSDDRQVYEYTGEELHIPYKVEGMDESIRSDFGLMVFVDGISQSYKILYKDGTVTDSKYLHKFYLNNRERHEFDIVFTPVAANEGDRLGIVFMTILNPDFMPEDGNYGIYHAVSANTAQEIYFKAMPDIKRLTAYSEYTTQPIPQDRIDRLSHFISGSDSNPIDSNLITEIAVNDEIVTQMKANSGKVTFTFNIYGGIEAAYRTMFFINHEPIEIMGANYLETKTEKGMMCSFDLEIDTTGMDPLSTLYAITNPSGKDYLAVALFPIKTRSILLINDKGEQKASPPSDSPVNKAYTDTLTRVSAGEIAKNSVTDTNSVKDLFMRASFDYETNSLLLHDDLANTVLKEIKYEKNSYGMSIYKFSSGYAVQVLNADKPVEVIRSEHGSSVNFPENILHRYLYVYDTSLKLVKEIALDSVIPKDAFDFASRITASEDGSKILMLYSQQLYLYDSLSGSVTRFMDETNNDISFKQALFTEDNKHIVFIGSSVKFEEGACVYGLVDINTKEMTTHVEKKFFVSHIEPSGSYAAICDNLNPDGFGGRPNGRVPILNLKTSEAFVMQVDDTESAFAKVTNDGKGLFTQKIIDEGIRIRLYDVETQKVIKEKLFAFKDGIRRISRIIYSGKGTVYYLVCLTEEDLYLYPFDCEAA